MPDGAGESGPRSASSRWWSSHPSRESRWVLFHPRPLVVGRQHQRGVPRGTPRGLRRALLERLAHEPSRVGMGASLPRPVPGRRSPCEEECSAPARMFGGRARTKGGSRGRGAGTRLRISRVAPLRAMRRLRHRSPRQLRSGRARRRSARWCACAETRRFGDPGQFAPGTRCRWGRLGERRAKFERRKERTAARRSGTRTGRSSPRG